MLARLLRTVRSAYEAKPDATAPLPASASITSANETIVLVRHAHAKFGKTWGRDTSRPLTPRGRLEAEDVAELFASREIRMIASSPARRCVETAEPLAALAGVKTKRYAVLKRDSGVKEPLRRLVSDFSRPSNSGVTVCFTHGETIQRILSEVSSPLPLRLLSKLVFLVLPRSRQIVSLRIDPRDRRIVRCYVGRISS